MSMNANSPSVSNAFSGLTRWLLSEDVLRADKSGAGVANYLSPEGTCNGLYPEIAGYYLQFLALTDDTGGVARKAASRVVQWLDDAGPQGDPLTLYFLDPANDDWRNECLFAFDLGMILRGFGKVETRWPGLVPPAVMQRYLSSAGSMITAGRLHSHDMRSGTAGHELPKKWSTTVDVHHVKIAAALVGLETKFTQSVDATLREQADALRAEGVSRMRELHPFLYLIEGWLMLWGQTGQQEYLDHANTAFQTLLGEFDPARGVLPPIAGRHDMATRSDVLGQALRAGLVLEHAKAFTGTAASAWPVARQTLEEALLARVTKEGAIEFDVVGHHRNVWASMFGWQALDFALQVKTGRFDPRSAAASLI
jgi:hypothetical protein